MIQRRKGGGKEGKDETEKGKEEVEKVEEQCSLLKIQPQYFFHILIVFVLDVHFLKDIEANIFLSQRNLLSPLCAGKQMLSSFEAEFDPIKTVETSASD